MSWYISRYPYKYSRGYNRLEVSLLKTIPVPDPTNVSSDLLVRLIALIDTCISSGPNQDIESDIDNLVFEIYGISQSDRYQLPG